MLVLGEVCSDEEVVKVFRSVNAHDWRVDSHDVFVSSPIVQVVDCFGVSPVEDRCRDVGWVVVDVDDRVDAAGSRGFSLAVRLVVCNDVVEGLDDERGNVVVGVPSSAEVFVKLFYVVVSHHCIAVQVVEAADLAEDESLESGFWVCRQFRDIEMLVPLLLVEAVLDAVVGVNGECDVEEVDCA